MAAGKDRVIELIAEFSARTEGFQKGVKAVSKGMKEVVDAGKVTTKTTNSQTKATEKSGKAAGGAAKSMASLAKGLSAVGAAMSVVTAAAGVAVAALQKMTVQGGKILTVTQAYEKNNERLAGSLQVLRGASRGLITDFALMEQANRAVALGAVKTTAEFAELTEVAIALGRAMNEDAGFALQSLTLGIGRQSRLFLDNLGLIVKVEEANRRYAASIGRVTGQLSEAQKKEAFRQEAMRVARAEVERLGGITLNAGDAFVALAAELTNVGDTVKRQLADWRALRDVIFGIQQALNRFITALSPGTQLALADIAQQFRKEDLDALEARLKRLNKLESEQRQLRMGGGALAPQLADALIRQGTGGTAEDLGDLFALIEGLQDQIKIVNDLTEDEAPLRALQAHLLTWEQLVQKQREFSTQLQRLEGLKAIEPIDANAQDLQSQIDQTRIVLKALEDEITATGAVNFPRVLDFMVAQTRTATDDMELAWARQQTSLIAQWGTLRDEWVEMLAQMEADIERTGVIEDLADRMNEVQRTMARLGRERAGSSAFTQSREDMEAIVTEVAKLRLGTQNTSKDWGKVTDLMDRALDILDDAKDSSAGFFENLKLAVKELTSLDALTDTLVTAAGGVLSGLISGALSSAGQAFAEGVKGLFAENGRDKFLAANTLAIKKNTEAIIQSVTGTAGGFVGGILAGVRDILKVGTGGLIPRGPGFVDRATKIFEAMGLSLKEVTDFAKELGVTLDSTAQTWSDFLRALEAQSLGTKTDLARRKISLLDIDDPAAQFDEFRKALASSLPAGLGITIARLGVDSIQGFVEGILSQIEAGTFDLRRLGDISLDDFLDVLGEMESLGDAAAAAGSELSGLAEVLRNVPTGFKVAFAQFAAATPSVIGTSPFVTDTTTGGGRGGGFTIDTVVVMANDPAEMLEQIEIAAKKQARRGGTTPLRLATSPSAVIAGGTI